MGRRLSQPGTAVVVFKDVAACCLEQLLTRMFSVAGLVFWHLSLNYFWKLFIGNFSKLIESILEV